MPFTPTQQEVLRYRKELIQPQINKLVNTMSRLEALDDLDDFFDDTQELSDALNEANLRIGDAADAIKAALSAQPPV